MPDFLIRPIEDILALTKTFEHVFVITIEGNNQDSLKLPMIFDQVMSITNNGNENVFIPGYS